MKYLLASLPLFVTTLLFAQNLPEEIARKSCECIGEPPNLDSLNARFKKCGSSAMAEVLISQKDSKFKYTVENIQKMWADVFLLLPSFCPGVAKIAGNQESKKGVKESAYQTSFSKKANKHFGRGTRLLNEQKYEQAIGAFKEALKEDENFVMALDNIGICYRRLNRLEDAMQYYEKSLAIFPEGDFALVNIGVVYTLQNNLDKALSTYQTILRLYPNDPEGPFGVGKTFFLQEKYEDALPMICKAFRMYLSEKSDYAADAESIIGLLHEKLKEAGKEEFFNNTMKKYNIEFNIK